jgi:hypothetical protein
MGTEWFILRSGEGGHLATNLVVEGRKMQLLRCW